MAKFKPGDICVVTSGRYCGHLVVVICDWYVDREFWGYDCFVSKYGSKIFPECSLKLLERGDA